MSLQRLLDWDFGEAGERRLRELLDAGVEVNTREGTMEETPLHVAVRRFRPRALTMLLDAGAEIDAHTAGGKTGYAHAARRGFQELCEILEARGADTSLNDADRFAVMVMRGELDEARRMLEADPSLAQTGNPEEDRLLADMAGRNDPIRVEFLIRAGAPLTATALDDGTPLHQAAWFGKPQNARLLLDAGAPLEIFDGVHESSPLGWAVHGSRYSGDAENRQDAYVELVTMLRDAGAKLHYFGEPDSDAYLRRMLEDASPRVRELLVSAPA